MSHTGIVSKNMALHGKMAYLCNIPYNWCSTFVSGFEKLDFSLYPDREYQLGWLRTYLEFSYEERSRDVSSVTDTDVERLYVQVNKFALVSGFRQLCESTANFCCILITVSLSTAVEL